jgi:hypothetical protein
MHEVRDLTCHNRWSVGSQLWLDVSLEFVSQVICHQTHHVNNYCKTCKEEGSIELSSSECGGGLVALNLRKISASTKDGILHASERILQRCSVRGDPYRVKLDGEKSKCASLAQEKSVINRI